MSTATIQPPWSAEDDAYLLAEIAQPRGRRQHVVLRDVGQAIGRSANACLHRLKKLRGELYAGRGLSPPREMSEADRRKRYGQRFKPALGIWVGGLRYDAHEVGGR